MGKIVPIAGCGCAGEECHAPQGDKRHGLAGTYNNRGCRCSRCRAAWRDYQRAWVNANPERAAFLRRRRRERYLASKHARKAVAA